MMLTGVRLQEISAEKMPTIIRRGETTIVTADGHTYTTTRLLADKLGVRRDALYDALQNNLHDGTIQHVDGFRGTARVMLVDAASAESSALGMLNAIQAASAQTEQRIAEKEAAKAALAAQKAQQVSESTQVEEPAIKAIIPGMPQEQEEAVAA